MESGQWNTAELKNVRIAEYLTQNNFARSVEGSAVDIEKQQAYFTNLFDWHMSRRKLTGIIILNYICFILIFYLLWPDQRLGPEM